MHSVVSREFPETTALVLVPVFQLLLNKIPFIGIKYISVHRSSDFSTLIAILYFSIVCTSIVPSVLKRRTIGSNLDISRFIYEIVDLIFEELCPLPNRKSRWIGVRNLSTRNISTAYSSTAGTSTTLSQKYTTLARKSLTNSAVPLASYTFHDDHSELNTFTFMI